MVFLYVSHILKRQMYVSSARKIDTHSSQRQRLFSCTKPPITGPVLRLCQCLPVIATTNIPILGPRFGAITKKEVALVLYLGTQMCAIVPDPTLEAGLPKNPAKKRQTSTDATLLETAEPTMNNVAKAD